MAEKRSNTGKVLTASSIVIVYGARGWWVDMASRRLIPKGRIAQREDRRDAEKVQTVWDAFREVRSPISMTAITTPHLAYVVPCLESGRQPGTVPPYSSGKGWQLYISRRNAHFFSGC